MNYDVPRRPGFCQGCAHWHEAAVAEGRAKLRAEKRVRELEAQLGLGIMPVQTTRERSPYGWANTGTSWVRSNTHADVWTNDPRYPPDMPLRGAVEVTLARACSGCGTPARYCPSRDPVRCCPECDHGCYGAPSAAEKNPG